ncbi:MAG: hypothetical protein WC374_04750 [Phycisphaerae bacterium]
MRRIEDIKADIAACDMCDWPKCSPKGGHKGNQFGTCATCEAIFKRNKEDLIKELAQLIISQMRSEICELLEAKRDGRCVVLRCKPGDTVYKLCPVNLSIPFGAMVDGMIVKDNCDRCPYRACVCFDITTGFTAITEIKNVTIDYIFKIRNQFGKNYFLTRPEAEAALKRR